jgi:hypothetical protein
MAFDAGARREFRALKEATAGKRLLHERQIWDLNHKAAFLRKASKSQQQ